MSGRADDTRFLSTGDRLLQGARRIITVPKPAAGAEWSQSVPAGVQWRLVAGGATFVASAAVANRNLGITLTLYGQLAYVNANTSNVTAGQTATAVYQPTTTLLPAATYNSLTPVPIWSPWLQQGDVIASSTVAKDVADQYSGVQLIVEEVTKTNTAYTDEHWHRAELEREALEAIAGQVPAGAAY